MALAGRFAFPDSERTRIEDLLALLEEKLSSAEPGMGKVKSEEQGSGCHTPVTLGDLLHVEPGNEAPSESQWVAFLNAIATGDRRALLTLACCRYPPASSHDAGSTGSRGRVSTALSRRY